MDDVSARRADTEGHGLTADSAGASIAGVIVLAAGEGTRMKSTTPKVLHQILGRSLLGHVLAAVTPLDAASTVVVVGHGRAAVSEHVDEIEARAQSVVQEQQNGTGHAVRIALDAAESGSEPSGPGALSGTVVVVCGDTPLLTTQTLRPLVERHASAGASATVLTAVLDDATGYGRVVRDATTGQVVRIVEERDADDAIRALTEINSGIYAFELDRLRSALDRLTTDNTQGEEYLTDVIGLLVADGDVVEAHSVTDVDDVWGVNDRVQLAAADAVMCRRINEAWMRAGVTIVDPSTTRIGVDVVLEADCVVHPWTVLEGKTQVSAHAQVGPGSQLSNTRVGAGAVVRFTTADGATIGERASVGPYTYLRPGTQIGRGARVGAFVETKNAEIGDDAKVPHLSYVGDAEIGVGSNIGAATVFVNYDGVDKHRTVIGDHVRVGSDTMLVAPVTVGDGAYTAAGSVITDDVPPGAMGVARARQRTIRDWVLRRRRGTSSAQAAEAAQAALAAEAAQPEHAAEQSDAEGDSGASVR